MQLSDILRALRRRWYATLLVVVVACGAAAALYNRMAKAPTGAATVQVLVDSPVSSLVNLQSDSAGLEARASVLAQAITSNAVLASIAKSAEVSPSDVTAQGPYTGPGESLDVPTPSEARSMQLVLVKPEYRLTVVAQLNLPIVTVQVQGPNPVAAGHLADAVVPGATAWLNSLATPEQVKEGKLIHLRQLGDAQAGSVNSSSAKMIAIVGAVAIIILGWLAIVLTDHERRERRRLEREEMAELLADDGFDTDHEAELALELVPPSDDARSKRDERPRRDERARRVEQPRRTKRPSNAHGRSPR